MNDLRPIFGKCRPVSFAFQGVSVSYSNRAFLRTYSQVEYISNCFIKQYCSIIQSNPIAHSEKRNPAQNKFRMGSDGYEGGHGKAEAERHCPAVSRSGCCSVTEFICQSHHLLYRKKFEQSVELEHQQEHWRILKSENRIAKRYCNKRNAVRQGRTR